ncbi:MAG: hypothetical protein RH942_03870 [Kiloniellaceae bacterium]
MVEQLPVAAAATQARRERRMHHYLWHQVRDGWLFYDQDTRDKLARLSWEPPRPALRPDGDRRVPILDNASGEDFLYMHRQMITAMNARLSQIGDSSYLEVHGWQQIPRSDNSEYPVPPSYGSGDLRAYLDRVKSEEFFSSAFLPRESQFADPAYLNSVSLGELGTRIEFSVHNWMHMRWSREPAAFRADPAPGQAETIDPDWDNPEYDWLGDTYSSHVNSVFWKLHGWIDRRIDEWKAANRIIGEIPWTGTWVGNMPPHPAPDSLHAMLLTAHTATMGGGHHTGDHIAVMEKAVRIVARCGHIQHFYDEVDIP